MCGRVAYLCVAFLHLIAKVCEKFVNFKRIFCMNPDHVTTPPGSGDSAVVANTNSIVIFGGNIELRFRDRKVAGSRPRRSGGRIFFSGVNFPY